MTETVRLQQRDSTPQRESDPSLLDAFSSVVGAAQRVAVDRIEEGFLRVGAALEGIVDAGLLLLVAVVFAATAWLAFNGGVVLALLRVVSAPAALGIVATANLLPAVAICAVAVRRRARSRPGEREN